MYSEWNLPGEELDPELYIPGELFDYLWTTWIRSSTYLGTPGPGVAVTWGTPGSGVTPMGQVCVAGRPGGSDWSGAGTPDDEMPRPLHLGHYTPDDEMPRPLHLGHYSFLGPDHRPASRIMTHQSLWGELGCDPLWGELGCDPLWGELGCDPLWGELGCDPLWGELGCDPLWGELGCDPLWGELGCDPLWGELGCDPPVTMG